MLRERSVEGPAPVTTDALTVTVLICTHNRRALLERTIASLNAARRPHEAQVELLVVANACTDDTHTYLEDYARDLAGRLALRWVAEPTPGKSNALNRAYRELLGALVAFVDDDHRVDVGYLEGVAAAARAHPGTGLFCGRILPDWDGSEPDWVHDEGPYRIYPLPVPRFDLGDSPRELTWESPVPGGGNLVARRQAIEVTGGFATDRGPIGHNLGGAEDLDWVRRALRAAVRLRYAPEIVQFHYVDAGRLRLSYLVRKGYQRSKASISLDRQRRDVPLYMWRKLLEYFVQMLFAFDGARRRFFLVRFAAALGEIRGVADNVANSRSRAALPHLPQDVLLGLLCGAAVAAFALAIWLAGDAVARGVLPVAAISAFATLALVWKSVQDFSQTGPRIREEILGRYRLYTLYGLSRLAFWIWAIFAFFGAAGVIVYATLVVVLSLPFDPWLAVLAAVAGTACATLVQAGRKLRANPGLIVASWQYRLSRLNSWRDCITGKTWDRVMVALVLVLVLVALGALWIMVARGALREAGAILAALAGYAAMIAWAGWAVEPSARRCPQKADARPNILMIGSDTLRADRILNPAYPRRLTPNIERLAQRGTYFPQCYVPCARTAPSLISLFSGTWPHTHGVRDNFVAGSDVQLPVRMLPEFLHEQGYRTATVSDWCGGDFEKFSFGFDLVDVPDDQWNIRYLIRQGPKDLRLLLSLFCHNRFGRWALPEIHYLGGVPQTAHVGLRAREALSRLAACGEPFLLNVFFSTTHPPFASESPYWETYGSPRYRGESKFAMARLNDPFDIIRRQGDSQQEFDLEQIIDLYDGCVTRFDAELGRLLAHLDACECTKDTIVVIYSDHGMEFFEHGTWGQGNSAIGDFSARIPLLICDPRIDGGRRCEAVVRSIDVAPTLADLVGRNYAGPQGVSLRPLIDEPASDQGLAAFNETGIWITDIPGQPHGHLRYPDLDQLLDVADPTDGTLAVKDMFRELVIRAKDRMIRRGRWKLVYQPLEQGMRLQLFDLKLDPGCTSDLSAREPDVTARLWAELWGWIAADPVMAASIDRPLR
jgi:arylsulfatase A-like enzyme/GT2 family glycosyltransferase